DLNRRDASISTLESDVMRLKADLEENQNARRVLEQTVADRLPRVEARLAEAKRLLFNRDREIAELAATSRRQKQALEEATSVNAQKNTQIERLTTSLTARGSRGRQSSAEGGDVETALRSEVDVLRSKASDQAQLIDRLQRQLGQGRALAAPAKPAAAGNSESDTERARRDVAEAETALGNARAAAAGDGDAKDAALEREIRALTAKTEDQAGEIARLKAALAAFEQQDAKAGGLGGLKDSKIALKARLGSAQAQSDQQAATIAKLRAELAATHERLARQAAHFMGEMRRIGGGPVTGPGQARRTSQGDDRRSLADRVAQVRASASADRSVPTRPEPRAADSKPAEAPATANGHKAIASDDAGAEPVEQAPAAKSGVEERSAVEMPQADEIPDKRRRPRLLDRITGLAKS